MIARTWRGATSSEDAEAYHEYLNETGVRACEETPGNRGVYVLRRVVETRAEFLFVSLWDSMDAVTRFAGADARAVFYPEDERYLIDFDPDVTHYEVLVPPPRNGEATSDSRSASGSWLRPSKR
jgi:heme-degrading monooxygenase HmoA